MKFHCRSYQRASALVHLLFSSTAPIYTSVNWVYLATLRENDFVSVKDNTLRKGVTMTSESVRLPVKLGVTLV